MPFLTPNQRIKALKATLVMLLMATTKHTNWPFSQCSHQQNDRILHATYGANNANVHKNITTDQQYTGHIILLVLCNLL